MASHQDWQGLSLEDAEAMDPQELAALLEEAERATAQDGGGASGSGPQRGESEEEVRAQLEAVRRAREQKEALNERIKQAMLTGEGMSEFDSRSAAPTASATLDAVRAASMARRSTMEAEAARLSHELASARSRLDFRMKGVDLAIMMDCTGSMEWCIETVKSKVLDIMRLAPQQHPEAITRLAIVAYRDFGDGVHQLESHDFTEMKDIAGLLGMVRGLKAFGGDDGPEDVAGALQRLLGLSWQCSTRLVVHFGDYPAHGSKYNGGLPDNYPAGDPRSPALDPEALVAQLCANRIDYHFARILDRTDVMMGIFRRVYTNSGGAAVFTEHDFRDRAEGFMPLMLKSITASMRRSFRSGSSSGSRHSSGAPAPPITLPPVYGKLRRLT